MVDLGATLLHYLAFKHICVAWVIDNQMLRRIVSYLWIKTKGYIRIISHNNRLYKEIVISFPMYISFWLNMVDLHVLSWLELAHRFFSRGISRLISFWLVNNNTWNVFTSFKILFISPGRPNAARFSNFLFPVCITISNLDRWVLLRKQVFVTFLIRRLIVKMLRNWFDFNLVVLIFLIWLVLSCTH